MVAAFLFLQLVNAIHMGAYEVLQIFDHLKFVYYFCRYSKFSNMQLICVCGYSELKEKLQAAFKLDFAFLS
jgi:hypothetical protein